MVGRRNRVRTRPHFREIRPQAVRHRSFQTRAALDHPVAGWAAFAGCHAHVYAVHQPGAPVQESLSASPEVELGQGAGRCHFRPGGPARLTSAHFNFLQTLWGLQPIHRSGEDIVDEVASDWKAIGGRLDSRWNQLAAEALYVAKREIGGIEVPCGITHGDFAPWNTRTKNGNLGVFDWECARWSQPIWWDIFHFETQSSTLLKNTPRQGVPGADHPTFQTIHMMYLLSSTCRILSDEPSVMNGLQYRREILAAQLLRHAGARVARGAKPLLIG